MLGLTLAYAGPNFVCVLGGSFLFGYWGKSLRVSVGRAKGWVFVASLYCGRGHRMQR